jgi:hypothetical protein
MASNGKKFFDLTSNIYYETNHERNKAKKNVVPILTNVNDMLSSYMRCVSKNRLYTQFEFAY